MRATYKKRVLVGHGLHTGPVTAIQEVQLEIHYEAESCRGAELEKKKIITGEPYELQISHNDEFGGTHHFLSDVEIAISTLKLVIEEVTDDNPRPK